MLDGEEKTDLGGGVPHVIYPHLERHGAMH